MKEKINEILNEMHIYTEPETGYKTVQGHLYCSNKIMELIQQREEEIVEFLKQCKRPHYYCDDSWYSCPMAEDGCCDESQGSECNCGADEFNKNIDEFLKKHGMKL